jgi:hypothetical protein
MSAEAVIIQAGQGKALSLRGTQVAYKAEGRRPAGGPTFLASVVPTWCLRIVGTVPSGTRSGTAERRSVERRSIHVLSPRGIQWA